MAKPIVFGRYQYSTKKSVKEEARRRINQYKIGEKLNVEDELFFTSLFTLHSEYDEKKGVGIDHVKVERDFHKNRCLYIHHIDGSSIDCSWVQCIQPASKKTVVSMAFRRAVKERVLEFKKAKLKIIKVCPTLGIPLSHDNCHVSYLVPSFEQLLYNFLEQNQTEYESIHLTNPKSGDPDQRGILSSTELSIKWNEYHQENAGLQLLSADANLRRSKK